MTIIFRKKINYLKSIEKLLFYNYLVAVCGKITE